MYQRLLNPLKLQSFFLFGARGSGKTWFLRNHFENAPTLWIDLLNESEFLRLSRKPAELRERIEAKVKDSPLWVIIDEVQRVPRLLNEVQAIIEDPRLGAQVKFSLTGSSARKLKRGGGNLLAGRALLNQMFPLTNVELGEDFALEEALRWGTLPKVVTTTGSTEREELLEAYVATYLREEIRVEQIVRNLDPFLRFLEVAAQTNGEQINYSAIGRECLIDSRVVQRYYQILEDTLLGFFLTPYHRSVRKRQSQSPRFYFFDLGVVNALKGALGSSAKPHHYVYGKLFEQFLILEFHRLNAYWRRKFRFSFLRTADGAEIDLLLEASGKKPVAVEIKSAEYVSDVAISKFKKIADALPASRKIILCKEPTSREVDGVHVLPWREGIQQLLRQEEK